MAFACVSSQALFPGKARGHKFSTVCYFLREALILCGCCCGLLKMFMRMCQLVKPLKGEMPWPSVEEKGVAPWGRGWLLSGAWL